MNIGALLSETFSSWSEDNAFLLSAALAYYAVFSLAPLLIIAIAIAGWVFGDAAAQGRVFSEIQGLIGQAGAETIQDLIRNAARANSRLASGFGLLSLIFGATGVFVSLQEGLNRVWHVEPKPRNMILGFIRQRLHTFTMVLGIGFLLLVSLLLSAAIAAAGKYLDGAIGATQLWELANFVLSIVTITLLFAMIFRFLPDVSIGWGDVWLGAFVTAVLFTLGKFGIGLYLGKSSLTSVYGAAGSLVLILAWVYYSSLILFLGAEFTRAYALHYGSRITPAANAEKAVARPLRKTASG